MHSRMAYFEGREQSTEQWLRGSEFKGRKAPTWFSNLEPLVRRKRFFQPFNYSYYALFTVARET